MNREVNPLNRKLKVYIWPTDIDIDIDPVLRVKVHSLVDNEESELVFDETIENLQDYTVFMDGRVKYYIGDIHILDKQAYRITAFKPIKTYRLLEKN